MSLAWKLWCLLMPLTLVAGFYTRPMNGAPLAAPIAVVDRDAIVIQLAPELGTDGAIQQADAIVARLADQGYVVLDQRYVLRAPAAQTVRP